MPLIAVISIADGDYHPDPGGIYGYHDFSLPGIFAPTGNFRSWERKFSGTFVPGIVSLHLWLTVVSLCLAIFQVKLG